jgi:hypothetical protein
MKITKSICHLMQLESNRNIANQGCDKCPSCGEVSSMGCETSWCTGLFKMKYWKKNLYTCRMCKTEYESEPY